MMIYASLAITMGLLMLVWSADRFVAGSSALARHFNVPPLLVGMVIVGFGTSIPELIVSGFASFAGNGGIALGNAYGSNITNIALILGLSALIKPIYVNSQVLRKELPILVTITLFTVIIVWDGILSRWDAISLLTIFGCLMCWSFRQSRNETDDTFHTEMTSFSIQTMSVGRSVFWLLTGLTLLIVSSRLLIWGAVGLAKHFGVSDLIIGLTLVAVGTSLPELASSVMASRRGEDDIAIGNILGSNLFNTLMVVGLGGMIRPMAVEPALIHRDIPVMAVLTISLFGFC